MTLFESFIGTLQWTLIVSIKITLDLLITKLSLEKNKNICIAGDFNVNLVNVSSHDPSLDFMNILSSNHFLPTITLQTKLNLSGKDTLIDNIFSNIFNLDIFHHLLFFLKPIKTIFQKSTISINII